MRRQSLLPVFALIVAVPELPATDIPAEIADSCLFFGYCTPSELGTSGAFSYHSGTGNLTAWSTAHAGTLADPWLLSMNVGGPVTIVSEGDQAGGPLRSPTDLNALGTGHVTGRFFRVAITNTS